MHRSPDAEPADLRFLASGHDDHPAHRDPHHRRRPGRPLHRLPPAAARAALPRSSTATSASATTGASSGTPCGSTAPPSTTACPACRSRPRRGRSRARTRSPTTSRVRAALRPAGADEHPRRAARGRAPAAASPRASARTPITCDNVVVATGTFGRTPNVPDFAARPRPVDPAAALQRVPPTRPARATGRCSSSAPPTRAATSPTRPPSTGPRPWSAATAGRSRSAGSSRALRVRVPGARVRVAPRPHPAYADRPQGDGARSATTAARCCGSSAPTSTRAASSACTNRVAGVSDGRPVLDDGTRRRRGHRRLVHRASGRSSTGSTCRSSARTAGRGSTAASSTTVPGLFFCGLAFQYAFSSMVLPGCRPRRRVRRRAGSPRAA